MCLRISSSIRCIDELLMSVASRLEKHRKWLLNGLMPHTVAIDRAILSCPVSKPVLLRGMQG